MSASQYPWLRVTGVGSIGGVNPFLLTQLNKLGQQLGKTIDIYSGYRSSSYSASVGGFAGDPHSRGEAVDARIDGQEIGNVVPLQTLANLGLEGGNTPGFYPGHGDGGRDPGHVQIPNSGNKKWMVSPTLGQATGNPAAGNTPPPELLSATTPAAGTSIYSNLWHGQQTPTRIVLHSTDSEHVPSYYGGFFERQGRGFGAQIIVGRGGRIVRLVPDNQIAFGTGGNNTGTLDIEIVGDEHDPREKWLANPEQLHTVAQVIAGWSQKYGIPIVIDTSTRGGISTHAMNSALYPRSEGHQDPGPGFPLAQVIAQAKVYADQGLGVVPADTIGTPALPVPVGKRPAVPVTQAPSLPGGTDPSTGPVPTDPAIMQQIFAKEVSRATGIDPRVLMAWSSQEGTYAPKGTGGYNFLNLRPDRSAAHGDVGVVSYSKGGFNQFASLRDAITSTINRIHQPFIWDYLGPVLKRGGGPIEQIAAIAASRWDGKDHYGGSQFAGGPNLLRAYYGAKSPTTTYNLPGGDNTTSAGTTLVSGAATTPTTTTPTTTTLTATTPGATTPIVSPAPPPQPPKLPAYPGAAAAPPLKLLPDAGPPKAGKAKPIPKLLPRTAAANILTQIDQQTSQIYPAGAQTGPQPNAPALDASGQLIPMPVSGQAAPITAGDIISQAATMPEFQPGAAPAGTTDAPAVHLEDPWAANLPDLAHVLDLAKLHALDSFAGFHAHSFHRYLETAQGRSASGRLHELAARAGSKRQPSKRDLLFFGKGGRVSHAGMSLGGDHFIHGTNGGRTIQVSSLKQEPYASSLLAVGR